MFHRLSFLCGAYLLKPVGSQCESNSALIDQVNKPLSSYTSQTQKKYVCTEHEASPLAPITSLRLLLSDSIVGEEFRNAPVDWLLIIIGLKPVIGDQPVVSRADQKDQSHAAKLDVFPLSHIHKLHSIQFISLYL